MEVRYAFAQGIEKSVIGHSHNDYEQVNPLFDALSNNFTSIEVDVHLIGTELKVSHNSKKLDQKPTLQQLYLDPIDSLLNIRNDNRKWIDKPITLMIDLKTNDRETLQVLDHILNQYDHLLQKRTENGIRRGPVRVLISGDPPTDAWLSVDSPYFYLDGRLSTKYPDQMRRQILRISAPIYRVISKSDLMNNNSVAYKRLKDLIKNLYILGYEEVRFWAAPNKPRTWKALIDMGVNVISVDELSEFRTHIEDHQP
jgi:hypothetical protein